MRFIDQLNQVSLHPLPEVRTLFEPERAIYVARAPGRLDVMGGIADCSGSLVLQLPIAEVTVAAVQPTRDNTITIISLGPDRPHGLSQFTMPMADLVEMSCETAAATFNIALLPRELALLCQVVENQIVGAPCGVMDQMTPLPC